MEDFEKAKEIAQVYQKPLILVFLGSDWCAQSQKFIKEVLHDAEFEKNCNHDFLFVTIDFPELNKQSSRLLEKNYELKNQFHVENFPTCIVLNSEGEEVSQFGYPADMGKDLARHLRQMINDYRKLKSNIDQISLKQANMSELKSLYIHSRDLGCEQMMQAILNEGIQREDGSFFMLEKYCNLVGQGKKDSEEAKQIRSHFDSKEGEDTIGANLRFAMLDFQENAGNHLMHPKQVIEPLTSYLADHKEGEIWRVCMMVSQYLFSYGYLDDALRFIKDGKEVVPKQHLAEVEEMESFILSQMHPTMEE